MALRETENNAYAKSLFGRKSSTKITFVVDFLGKKIDLKIESLPLHLTAILKAILWYIVVRAQRDSG